MPNNLSSVGTFTWSPSKFGGGTGSMAGQGRGPSMTTLGITATTGFTIEGWYAVNAATGSVVVIFGNHQFWVGMSSGGNLQAQIGSGGAGSLFFTGTSAQVLTSSGGTTYHHLALQASPAGVQIFYDGTQVYSSSNSLSSTTMTFGTVLGLHSLDDGTFSSGGGLDELAIFTGARYPVVTTGTSSFTPPSAAYLGSETNLVALYHLDGNGNDTAGASTAASAYTVTGPTTGTNGSQSTAFTGTLGAGTLASNDTITLSDGGGGGTFQAAPGGGNVTTVALPSGAATSVSFYYTPGSTGTKVLSWTDSAGLTPSPASISYVSSAAGSPAIGQPAISGLVVGGTTTVSGSFSNGAPTGLTYSLDGGGAVTVSSPTITTTSGSGGTAAGTYSFTLTTPAAASHTITVTGTGAANTATSPSQSFTTTASGAIAPNDAAFLYSPYNWSVPTSAAATSWNPGAYFKIMFTGASCVSKWDVSNGNTSEIWWRVNGGPWTATVVAATITHTIPTQPIGLAAFPWHTLEVVFKSMASSSSSYNRWGPSAVTAITFNGLTLAAGAAVTKPPTKPYNVLVYGDSIAEGCLIYGEYNGSSGVPTNDAMFCWALELRNLLDAEVGVVGWGGTGYTSTFGGAPVLGTSYNLLASGVSRVFTPEPDLIINNHGQNDGSSNIQAAATTVLNNLLTACPTKAKIVLLNPFAKSLNTYLQAAAAACNQPSRVRFISTTGFYSTQYGGDASGIHPFGPNSRDIIAPKVAAAVLSLMPRGTRWSKS